MILEQETYEKFGYDPRELKPRSRKNVLVKCDKCGIIREIRMDSYSDLCVSCSHLGQTPWNKGKKATEKAKKKQSLAHLGQPAWNKGVPWSEESKEKMSISHIGKTLSEDHKKSISAALGGHSVSDETRNKIKETQGRGGRAFKL